MKKLVSIGLVVMLLLGIGGGYSFARMKYFSSNVEWLNKYSKEKFEKFMENEAPAHGSMQTYLTQKYPELAQFSDDYFDQAKEKWLENQRTLSPEEKAIIDKDFKEAKKRVKEYIDGLFESVGGY